MPAERLQKLIARAGYGSRRHAEELVRAGRVTVDGVVATLGTQADPDTQIVAVDGHPLPGADASALLVLHKPVGYIVSAHDEHGRPTVYDLLHDAPPSLRYVGRLDFDTSGVLLLTTNGELAHRLTHPRYEVEKVYEATVRGTPDSIALGRLRAGVLLEDGWTAPAHVDLIGRAPHDPRDAVVRLVLHEGRKRQVRRMCEAVGHPVLNLVRTRVGPITLEGLLAGEARSLTAPERVALYALVALPEEAPRARPGAPFDGAEGPSLSSDATATPPSAKGIHTVPDAVTPEESLARSVAIDGPTASGKSVVGRAIAEALHLGFVDTGLMYRACTLAVREAQVDPEDEAAVIALVQALPIDMRWPEPSQPHVWLGDRDVTPGLRDPEIERTVSLISRIPAVRDELVRRQREIGRRAPIVMAGRDIGTRVLTEARTKVFLDASNEVRARRRLGEETLTGRQTSFEQVLDETRRRDALDSTGHRAIRREQAADDALIVDTDMLGIDQVVETCLLHYRARNPGVQEPPRPR